MSIEIGSIKKYWEDRANRQGYLTVGTSIDEFYQDEEYKEKQDFIFSHLPINLRTLDYGCGVGRYSKFFDKYLGVDITKPLLNIAKQMNPDKDYVLMETPYDINMKYDFELFFTSTVLQHNSDDVVSKLFFEISQIKKRYLCLAFYENSIIEESYHVKGRNMFDYKKLLSLFFDIQSFEYYPHIVHGEEHTLSIFTV